MAAVVVQDRRGFVTIDVDVLAASGDHDDDHGRYSAQAIAQPVHGWTGRDRSYKGATRFLERVSSMPVSGVLLALCGAVAEACCVFQCEGKENPGLGQRIAAVSEAVASQRTGIIPFSRRSFSSAASQDS
jgi:hypothetical protein